MQYTDQIPRKKVISLLRGLTVLWTWKQDGRRGWGGVAGVTEEKRVPEIDAGTYSIQGV